MLRIYGLLLLLDLVWTHAPGLEPGPGPGPVFVSPEEAQQVLVRRRRANQVFEETKQGDLERECVEEICNYEEAREIFENDKLTYEFWAKYVDGDACVSSPCLNQGHCKDTIGGFQCFCAAGFHGFYCERELFKPGVTITERPTVPQTDFSDHNQTLNLTQDQTETRPDLSGPNRTDTVQSPVHSPDCAQNSSVIGRYDCPPGEFSWQALLLNEDHRGFCEGTILNDLIVLTAAHCMNQSRSIYVVMGEFDTRVKHGNETVHQVEKVLVHQRHSPETHHNDIALLKLKTPISFSRYILPACLPTRDSAEKVSKYLGWIREGIRVLGQQSLGQNQDQPKRKRSSGPQPQQVLGPDRDPPRTKRSGPEPSQNLRPRGFQVLYL